jgi:hypothetical protein
LHFKVSGDVSTGKFEVKVNRQRPQAANVKKTRQHEGVMKALNNGVSYDELKVLKPPVVEPVVIE